MVNPVFDPSLRLYITTGGSSGVPVGFYLQKGVSRPKEQSYLEAQWARRGYRAGDRVAVIRGGVTSSKAGGGISYYACDAELAHPILVSSDAGAAARVCRGAESLSSAAPSCVSECGTDVSAWIGAVGFEAGVPVDVVAVWGRRS